MNGGAQKLEQNGQTVRVHIAECSVIIAWSCLFDYALIPAMNGGAQSVHSDEVCMPLN